MWCGNVKHFVYATKYFVHDFLPALQIIACIYFSAKPEEKPEGEEHFLVVGKWYPATANVGGTIL